MMAKLRCVCGLLMAGAHRFTECALKRSEVFNVTVCLEVQCKVFGGISWKLCCLTDRIKRSIVLDYLFQVNQNFARFYSAG